MEELRNSNLFFWPGNQGLPGAYESGPSLLGTESQQGNVKNIFNDPIDAVELIGLKLNQRVRNC